MRKKLIKKCCKCGKPIWTAKSEYCFDCAVLSYRMFDRKLSHEAIEGVWDYIRQHGKRCYYSKMLLDERDPKSPWYLVFDHWIPGDGRRVVITSSLFNEMKTDLSEDEFWDMIDQLVKHKKYGIPIKKRELRYWKRPYIKMSLSEPPTATPVRYCLICGEPVRFKRSRYCVQCGYIRDRLQSEHLGPEVDREIWEYLRQPENRYRCSYSNVSLELIDYNSPWYLSFDHRTPGNKKDVVLTCVLFNEMKTDLTEEEFWYYIFQLDNYRKKGTKVRKKKLAHWYRLQPVEVK